MHPPGAAAALLDRRAKRPQRLRGVEHVLAFEQSADPRFADRQRAENERANGDRLVARHPGVAFQRTIAPGGERSGLGVHDIKSSARLLARPSRLAHKTPSFAAEER